MDLVASPPQDVDTLRQSQPTFMMQRTRTPPKYLFDFPIDYLPCRCLRALLVLDCMMISTPCSPHPIFSAILLRNMI